MATQVASVQPSSRQRAAITLFVILAAESVFFGSLVMVYFYLRSRVGYPPFEAGGLYHLSVPLANTAILLFSSLCAWASTRHMAKGNTRAAEGWTWAALALGLVFIAGQVLEFQNSGFQISDAAYGGVFFALMGFHALHVIGGGVFLAINAWRLAAGDFSVEEHAALSAGAWFWYYVFLVWLVLFSVLFLV